MNLFEILYSATKFYLQMSIFISLSMTTMCISSIIGCYDGDKKLVIFFKSFCLFIILLVFSFIFWPVIIRDLSKRLIEYLYEYF
jgi:hypothetical protein